MARYDAELVGLAVRQDVVSSMYIAHDAKIVNTVSIDHDMVNAANQAFQTADNRDRQQWRLTSVSVTDRNPYAYL